LTYRVAIFRQCFLFQIINSISYKVQSKAIVSVVTIPQWKRTLDVALVIVALPLLLPLAMLIGLLIRIFSAGPVLFKQERIGYLGERFLCYKFRTMFINSDPTIHQGHLNQLMNSDAPMMKMDSHGDPRIIPFGRLLRASGLDELPQLVNVLRGEMSLVGPRPCVSYEYEKYLPWQRERFNTLPGLTGLWQVSGKNRTTFTEMIQLDINYVRSKTPWQDLKIIFKTIPALIIQMYETRIRRKSVAQAAKSEAALLDQADNQCCMTKAALISVAGEVNDRTREEIKKETLYGKTN
jgi:exopolysaccharide production protein ExoY